MFQNLKFWRKKNKKITIKKSKKIPYLPLIMWFWKFSQKKDDFIKKVNFSIDNDFQYFPPKNLFILGKWYPRKFGRQKNLFPAMSSRGQLYPPHSVAEKSSKSAKIIPMGTLTKTRKTRLSIAKRQNGKTSEKNVPMGISTKIFKNLSDV